MKLGSLCSGAGGLDMAVEAVFGAETVWHAELDPAASKVLAHRWPGVPNHGDLTTTDWSSVEPVDVIAAGWPCQPWSVAGKRKGAEDDRAIWPHIADAVRVLRPRYVCLENVSAVVGIGELWRVANDLAALGYLGSWTCLRASDVGAPHRRERLFIVAHEGRPESAGFVGGSDAALSGDGPLLPTPAVNDIGEGKTVEWWDEWTAKSKAKHGNGNGHGNSLAIEAQRIAGDGPVNLLPTPCAGDGMAGRNYGRNGTQINLKGIVRVLDGDTSGLPDCGELNALLPTPRTSDTNGAGAHGNGGKQRSREALERGQTNLTDLPRLLPTPSLSDSKTPRRGDQLHACLEGSSHTLNLADAIEHQHGRDALLCTPSASDGSGGKTSRSGGRIDEPLLGGQAREMVTTWGKYEPAIHRWEQVLGRTAPSPTEPNKNGNPRLSAAFSEWMMGWPAGWVTDVPGITRNDKLRIIGNGVVPQQAAAALQWLSLQAVA